ncbi:MAG: peptidoglycan DD-metalloendopeptidase family protein [Bacteroidota bacterium]|nr:peptidoglycan DD-metalloendopeptidase family protein [Bacteroidota bacterium]
MGENALYSLLQKHAEEFHSVVPFDAKKDKLLQLHFTSANTALSDEILVDTELFSLYIDKQLGRKYTYGIGGYAEHRTIYSRSRQFDSVEQPRRLHLGIDVWGAAGTPVFAPLGGYVHSFAFNDHFGDYGATIILHHQLDRISFNTLYGHLSKKDLDGLQEGVYICRGAEFAHFGAPAENGHWPPHLHFQVIKEMYEKKGDYPGVCKYSEREKYLASCPDPDAILQMMQYTVKS